MLEGFGKSFEQNVEAFFGVDATDVESKGCFGQFVLGVDFWIGFFGVKFGKVDAIAEGLNGDAKFMAIGDKIVNSDFCGHGSVGAFFEEAGEIVANYDIERFFDATGEFELAGDIVWISMASGDERNTVFVGVAKDGPGNGAGSLVVDEIGLELVQYLFDFGIRRETEVKTVFVGDAGEFFAENFDVFGYFVDLVGVEGELGTGQAGNFEAVLRVGFDVEFSGGAGGKDDDGVTALGEAGSEIARKDGYTVNHRAVDVGGNGDLHVMMIISCRCRGRFTMCGWEISRCRRGMRNLLMDGAN